MTTEIRREYVPGPKIADGKTKVIYAGEQPGLVYMSHKDDITAGDGAKRDVIQGKGELSCRTTSAVYRYLERQNIPTHFVDQLDERTMLVRHVEMIPIEWVARRIATGSYVRRTGAVEGTRFDPLILELFYKDDANHDPQITPEEAVSMGLCSREEVEAALSITQAVFLTLEQAWAAQDVQLVDLKIELGRPASRFQTPASRIQAADGALVVADVIDNDSWRLWPGGRKEEMLDKQVYRNLAASSAENLADVRRRYVEVAERVERFPIEAAR